MADAALKRLMRLALGAAYYPGDALPTAFSRVWFEDFRPNARREPVDQQATLGGMGTLTHYNASKRLNRILVEPELTLKPTIAEWQVILAWLMNGTPTVSSGVYTYPLGKVGSRRTISFDDTVRVWTLTDVQCARWEVTAQAGGEVSLRVGAVGITYDIATAFPSGSNLTQLEQKPNRFMAGDSLVTATDGSGTFTVPWRSLTLSCDHGTNNDRFWGTYTSAGPVNTDRQITLRLELPYALNSRLWAGASGDDGLPMSVGFVLPTLDGSGAPTGESRSLKFNLAGVKAPAPSVEPEDPEAFVTWEGQAGVPVAAGNTSPNYGQELEMVTVLDTTS